MLTSVWVWLFAVLSVLFSVGVTIHAVMWKRDSRAVIAWVGLAWLAPLLGTIAYLCLGVNRIHRKAAGLQLQSAWRHRREPELTLQDIAQQESFVATYPNLVGLAELGHRSTGIHVVPGNRVEVLRNGDEAYPAMIAAIEQATTSVALLSYIFDSDRAGDAFLDALVAAEQRGVAVRVLIDDVGSKYSRPNMVGRLTDAGIRAASFLPTRRSLIPRYANMRNHRKILVTDGRIGFTGGTNIRAGHCLEWKTDFPVQCLHFQLCGPVVAHLQETFAIDWAFASGESLTGATWFPEIERQGSLWARGINHGPDEDFERMADVLHGALAVARTRVRIVTPYFLPHAPLIHALQVAAMRGVDVEIYLPAENNIALVQWAATAQLWQILAKGCRVFSTPPPFDHTKLVVVDDVWSLVGSTNWDPRSLRLNFEFNVECYDAELAAAVNEIVDAKRAAASEVTLADVNGRPFAIRLRDGLARLASPYL